MKEIFKQAEEILNKLLEKKSLPYSELRNIPRKRGVYLIYNRENKIIYVGESNKLKVRLLSDHISGELKISTSTFRRKLTREPYHLKSGNEMLNWIKENCLFCWTEIEDKDLCHLVESLLITYLRRKRMDLLNS